jgi:hypothetical protein
MFLPQGAVIEPCIDHGAGVSVLKTPHPGKPGRILALEELPERYCAHLLKGIGKIAFKIFGEVFPLAIFDQIAAKLDDLKILQVFHTIHSLVPRILTSLSECRGADRKQ